MRDGLKGRCELIIKHLLSVETARIEDILSLTGASAACIRRDLSHLANLGLIRRANGGATLAEPLLYEPFRYDSSFIARERMFAAEKRRIGLAAAELVKPDETIGISAGTTTTYIGRALRHRKKIRVVTNAMNISMELCNQPGIRIYLTGGVMSWPWSFSITGDPALKLLDNFYLDRVFLSVTGLDAERGATTLETEEALICRKMLQRSKQVIIVSDTSKLGRVGPALVCQTKEIDTIITNMGAPAELLAPFEQHGIRVVCV